MWGLQDVFSKLEVGRLLLHCSRHSICSKAVVEPGDYEQKNSQELAQCRKASQGMVVWRNGSGSENGGKDELHLENVLCEADAWDAPDAVAEKGGHAEVSEDAGAGAVRVEVKELYEELKDLLGVVGEA